MRSRLQLYDRKNVYRTIPTSNHNYIWKYPKFIKVVYRTIPTSNHNGRNLRSTIIKLYIVLFLHQTTTKTKTALNLLSCISYYSYIKPQHVLPFLTFSSVVYRTIPTSNHNIGCALPYSGKLYIVLFLHQTTTPKPWGMDFPQLYIVLFLHQTTTLEVFCIEDDGCISYYSYIKPQRSQLQTISQRVVYRTIPTSNHN